LVINSIRVNADAFSVFFRQAKILINMVLDNDLISNMNFGFRPVEIIAREIWHTIFFNISVNFFNLYTGLVLSVST
jgi:hypothetical protein